MYDEEIEDTNQIIFRIPKNLNKIDNLILCYDGQNLFDSSTSHFETIFDLESLIKSIKPDILVVGSDWEGKEVVGSQYAKEVIFFPRVGEYSTTKVLSNDNLC